MTFDPLGKILGKTIVKDSYGRNKKAELCSECKQEAADWHHKTKNKSLCKYCLDDTSDDIDDYSKIPGRVDYYTRGRG